jgi:hypothetical protein
MDGRSKGLLLCFLGRRSRCGPTSSIHGVVRSRHLHIDVLRNAGAVAGARVGKKRLRARQTSLDAPGKERLDPLRN